MLFPVSGVETSPFLPPLAAFAVSFLTSMSGISGAFLLLPFQVSVLGYASPSVSATNHVFNTVATPGGVYRYYREGRLLLPLAAITASGCLPGVIMGAVIRLEFLADAASFKFFAGMVLLFLSLRIARDLSRPGENPPAPGKERPVLIRFGFRLAEFTFQGRRYSFRPGRVFALTSIIGLVGGIYGIGGGAILAPFLVSVFGLPVHVVAGPTLLCTLTTSLAGMGSYLLLAGFYPSLTVSPDWALGGLFGLGGLGGMYCGARLQKHIPGRPIKILLTLIICGTALSWLKPQLAALGKMQVLP